MNANEIFVNFLKLTQKEREVFLKKVATSVKIVVTRQDSDDFSLDFGEDIETEVNERDVKCFKNKIHIRIY